MTWRQVLVVTAVVAFVLATFLSFGWFDSQPDDAGDVLGVGFVGLALFAAAHLRDHP